MKMFARICVIFYCLLILRHIVKGAVTIGPVIDTHGPDRITEGSDVTWSCTATCNISCNYTWDVPPGVGQQSGASLVLTQVTRSYAGDYTCVVQDMNDTETNASIPERLTVLYGPDSVQLEPPDSTLTLVEDTAFTPITCRPGDCVPACTTRWLRESNIETGNSLLYIPNTKREIAGQYRCVVQNPETGKNNSESYVTVVVQYAPDVTLDWSDTTKQFRCTAAGVPADYTFHEWTHQVGDVIIRRMNGSLESTGVNILPVPAPNYKDTGSYTCSVDNDIQLIQNRTYEKSFEDTPLVVASESNYNVSKGDPVTIKIDIYANPRPTNEDINITQTAGDNLTNAIDGRKDNVIVDIDNTAMVNVSFYTTYVEVNGSQIKIRFLSVREEDFGNYNVTIRNTKGSVPTGISISPHGPPDPPFNLEVTERSDTSITIEFNSGFYNGANQSFVFSYKTSKVGSQWLDGSTVQVGQVKTRASTTIVGLQPETIYTFRSFGYNVYGNSAVEVLNATTLAEPLNYAAIVGGSAGGATGIILAVVAIFCLRRCRKNTKTKENIPVDLDMEDAVPGQDNITYENHGPPPPKVESVIYANTVIAAPGTTIYENTQANEAQKSNVAIVQPLPINEAMDSDYYNTTHLAKQAVSPSRPKRLPTYTNVSKPRTVPAGTSGVGLDTQQPQAEQPSQTFEPDQDDTYLDMDISKSIKEQKDERNANLIQQISHRFSKKKPVPRETPMELYMDMAVTRKNRPESIPDFAAPAPPPPVTESEYMNINITKGRKK